MQKFIFILTIALFIQFHYYAQGCVAVEPSHLASNARQAIDKRN